MSCTTTPRPYLYGLLSSTLHPPLTLHQNVPAYDVEYSETMLYYVRLLEDEGQYTESLSVLDASSKERTIVDKTSIMEIRCM